MTARSESWSVSYNNPNSISHPRSPAIQLDDDARGQKVPDSSEPPLGSRSPLPRRQGLTGSSSTLFLLPGRQARGWRGGSTSTSSRQQQVAGGRSDHGRVRFDMVVQLILVPSRKDMSHDLSHELWWNQEDYLRFRLGAVVEDSAGLLRRPLRKKRSRRAQAARGNKSACPPDPRLTHALQSRSSGSSGMRPIRQHFKLRSLPSYGGAQPLRFKPAILPPSPEKPLCADGAADRANESPAESGPCPRPAGGERGSVQDFDGFVSVCGLPGSIATALEC